MQKDYFSKLLGASPLFMKSDHDGENDGYNSSLHLGIKTVEEGFKHFTGTKAYSNVLDSNALFEKNGSIKFEDSQPNRINFSQPYVPNFYYKLGVGRSWASAPPKQDYPHLYASLPVRRDVGLDSYHNLDLPIPEDAHESYAYASKSFSDEWSCNKVKILDDLAFVAYDEYTHIHRTDIDLSDIVFKQYVEVRNNWDTSNTTNQLTGRVGTLLGTTNKMTAGAGSARVVGASSNVDGDFLGATTYAQSFTGSPAANDNFHNCVLRVKFEDGSGAGGIGYFLYGGVLQDDFPDANTALNKRSLIYDESFNENFDPFVQLQEGHKISTCKRYDGLPDDNIIGSKFFNQSATFEDGKICGRFCIVTPHNEQSFFSDNAYDDVSNKYNFCGGRQSNAAPPAAHIQLTGQLNYNGNYSLVESYTEFLTGDLVSLYAATANITEVKLIKITPVRKCGKVDFYKRKTRKVYSISDSIVRSSDPATPQGHGLKTNDIIEFNGVMNDGGYVGFSVIHPLNGIKYVQVLDEFTFKIFDDEFFKKPSFTGNIQTLDGVSWRCVSNSYGSNSQSWEYQKSIFSPTGMNGYKFIDTTYDHDDFANRPSLLDRQAYWLDYYDDTLARPEEFLTDNRQNILYNTQQRNLAALSGAHDDSSCINIRFDDTWANLVNSDFGEGIDKGIVKSFNGPSPTFDSALNTLHRGYWNFFPFDCQDKPGSKQEGKSPYNGCNFGCDFDIEFSHNSGDSKVYILAVGEKGSDIAVDFFNNETGSTGRVAPGLESWSNSYTIVGSTGGDSVWSLDGGNDNVVPWYYPHGKTHLFEITVDKYGNVTNIEHVNSLFGGGRAIVDIRKYKRFAIDIRKEDNPKCLWIRRSRQIYDTYTESLTGSAPYYKDAYTDNTSNQSINIQSLDARNWLSTYIEWDRFLDDDGNQVAYSDYWQRSAAVHWFAQDINDFKINSDASRDYFYKRQFYGLENTNRLRGFQISSPPNSSSSNTGKSLFGYIPFGGDPIPYKKTYYGPTSNVNNPRDLLPKLLYEYVDSFGKSVAIKSKRLANQVPFNVTGSAFDTFFDSDAKMVVLSASSSRSNYPVPFENTPFEFYLDSVGHDQDDSTSQIGQIQANFVYHRNPANHPAFNGEYENIDFMALNAGGSDCARFYKNMITEPMRTTSNLSSTRLVRTLPQGHRAGYGVAHVVSSCHLSASSIEWTDDDKIIWADQRLDSSMSTVNVLSFQDSLTDKCFQPFDLLNKNFIDSKEFENGIPLARNVGDGFGSSFKIKDNLFVTNARSNTTETGNLITDYQSASRFRVYLPDGSVSDQSKVIDRLDYLHVYELGSDGKFDAQSGFQKISATFDALNSDYPAFLDLISSNLYLNAHDLSSVSYDNTSVNTRTWEINLDNRYDIINGDILLKDPLEYALFSRDENITSEQSNASPFVEVTEADLYLAISEKFSPPFSSARNTRNYTPGDNSTLELSYEYHPRTQTSYSCSTYGGNIYDQYNERVYDKVPVLYYDIPVSDIDELESIEITFTVSNSFGSFEKVRRLGSQSSPEILASEDIYNTLYPRLVFYGKDPRRTIMEHGPADPNLTTSLDISTWDGEELYLNGLLDWVSPYADKQTHKINSFRGWLQGGAQDLFYYALPRDLYRKSAPLIASNYIDNSSVLVGGSQNLGEYSDLTSGTRGFNAGDPVSNSAMSSVGSNLNHRPSKFYAHLDKPVRPIIDTTQQTFECVTVLTREQIKDFLIRGTCAGKIDRTADMIPSFDDAPHVYPLNRDVTYTLAVGLLMTNVDRYSYNYFFNAVSYSYEEFLNNITTGPLRHITGGSLPLNVTDPAPVRMPYQRHVNFFNGNGYWNSEYLNYEMSCDISNVAVNISKTIHPKRKYKSVYHKVGVFRYGDDAVNEVRDVEITTDQTGDSRNYQPFVTDKYIPISLDNGSRASISVSQRSSQQKTNTEVLEAKDISSLKSLFTIYPDESQTILYLDRETGALIDRLDEYNYIPTADFSSSSILGGFEIEDTLSDTSSVSPPLDLFTEAHEEYNYYLNLVTLGHGLAENNLKLFVEPFAGEEDKMSLWTGLKEYKEKNPDLYTFAPFGKPMSLFVFEVAPTDNLNLFAASPDAIGSLSLIMTPTVKDTLSTFISGPVSVDGSLPLVRVPYVSGDISLFTRPFDKDNNNVKLFTNGFGAEQASVPLSFSPGVSGALTLFLVDYPDHTQDMTLNMTGLGNHNDAMPLIVSRNTKDEDTSLFIKSESRANENIDLFINSQQELENSSSLFASGPIGINSSLDTIIVGNSSDNENIGLVIKDPKELLNNNISLYTENVQYTLPLVAKAPIAEQLSIYMAGDAFDISSELGLFLKAQSLASDVNLYMDVIGASDSGNVPLYIGKDAHAKHDISLYTNSDGRIASPGVRAFGSALSVSTSGSYSYYLRDDMSLHVEAPSFSLDSGVLPLFMKTEEPTLGENGRPADSGVSSLFVQGGNDGSVVERGYLSSASGALFISNREPASQSVNLYTHRPEEYAMPLYVHSFVANTGITVYTSGANLFSGSSDLYISPPDAKLLELFLRGYLE